MGFLPKISNSKTNVELSDTEDTTILNVEDEGWIDFISLVTSRTGVEIALFINGVEAYRLPFNDLRDSYKLCVHGNDEYEDVPISIDNAGKKFKHIFNPPVDFTNSFTIKAKKLTSQSTYVTAWLVQYRLRETNS